MSGIALTIINRIQEFVGTSLSSLSGSQDSNENKYLKLPVLITNPQVF